MLLYFAIQTKICCYLRYSHRLNLSLKTQLQQPMFISDIILKIQAMKTQMHLTLFVFENKEFRDLHYCFLCCYILNQKHIKMCYSYLQGNLEQCLNQLLNKKWQYNSLENMEQNLTQYLQRILQLYLHIFIGNYRCCLRSTHMDLFVYSTRYSLQNCYNKRANNNSRQFMY